MLTPWVDAWSPLMQMEVLWWLQQSAWPKGLIIKENVTFSLGILIVELGFFNIIITVPYT